MHLANPTLHNCPIPFPDELLHGFLGRFARLSGMFSIDGVRHSLKSLNQGLNEFSVVSALAKICKQDHDSLAAKLTMIPVLVPVSKYAHIGQPDARQQARPSLQLMRLPNQSLRWCPDCVKIDVGTLGFSYWRRLHQLQGIDWCSKHHAPLITTTPKSAIHTPGSDATHGPASLPQAIIDEEISSPAIRRFQQIVSWWLNRPTPLHLASWHAVIGQRCRETNLRVAEIGKRPIVSDLIQAELPSSWLARHIPEIINKTPATCIRKVDGACFDKHIVYPGLAYAVILTVLFESVDHAIALFAKAEEQLADPSLAKEPIAEALAAFLDGYSLHQACKKFGVSVASVEASLRRGFHPH